MPRPTKNSDTPKKKQQTPAAASSEVSDPQKPAAVDPLLLCMDDVLEALEAEEEAVVDAVTRYIALYAEQLAEALRAGNDYLDLLSPSPDTPAVQALAMALVLESAEEELDEC